MPKCGAKTRSGGNCRREALPGKRRCALHGGKSTGPKDQRGNKNAAKPGSLYSQYLTDEEREIAEQLELGSVDEELRLTRIRLMRALAREKERLDTLEVYETVNRTGGGEYSPGDEEKCRVRDYDALIDKLTTRIESLEMRRAQLLQSQLDTELKRLELLHRGLPEAKLPTNNKPAKADEETIKATVAKLRDQY
jgi:hypothetical protein